MAFLRIVFILAILKCIESANILYIIPFTSTSHYIMLRPIGLELARRGHNVTVITANKETDPPKNYRQVMVDDVKIWDLLQMERPNIFTMVDISTEYFHHEVFWKGGLFFTEVVFNSTEVKHFLKEDQSFDLVIAEQFFQEALYYLSYKYNAPLALITTFGNCMRHNIVTGNPPQVTTVVSEFLKVDDPFTFWGRLRNAYFVIYEYVWWKFIYLRDQEMLMLKYMPELAGGPTLYELQKNVSLMLINGHFSYDTPMALLPNIIEVGGLHLSKSNENIPKELKKLLDESKNGVVYVNFGSNVRSCELPTEKKEGFLKVFGNLTQTVLWKWEEDILEGKPSNVVIQKWFPQKEILAHPNIKLFVSHGGLIGTQEAIFNGVPIVGVPIYCDQYNNLLQIEEAGCGKILQYHDINEETLNRALNDILNNDSVARKAKEMSRRFQDRPMSALDTAMFWLEYIIRNDGAEFMKNPARNMNWFTYNLIDIYTLVLFTFIVIIFLVKYLITIIKLLSEKVNKLLYNYKFQIKQKSL